MLFLRAIHEEKRDRDHQKGTNGNFLDRHDVGRETINNKKNRKLQEDD